MPAAALATAKPAREGQGGRREEKPSRAIKLGAADEALPQRAIAASILSHAR